MLQNNEDLAPWRSPLARALHRNRALPFSRFLQLATVRANGTPANRTVVFRGFLAGTNQLLFVSDRRSEKTAQLEQNPNAEACWYFSKTREQFRLAGQIILITHETPQKHLVEARERIWQQLSDNARLQFAWPQPQDDRAEQSAFTPSPPNPQIPLETFCLLCFAVNYVDHLALRGDPQSRHLYQKISQIIGAAESASLAATEKWQVTAVNP